MKYVCSDLPSKSGLLLVLESFLSEIAVESHHLLLKILIHLIRGHAIHCSKHLIPTALSSHLEAMSIPIMETHDCTYSILFDQLNSGLASARRLPLGLENVREHIIPA